MTISQCNIWSKVLLLVALFFAGGAAQGAEKYGFSAGLKRCALWDTFFPISFQIPDLQNARFAPKPVFNVIYIAGDDTQHMDDFFDLYSVGGKPVWPMTPLLADGRSQPKCRKNGDCIESGKGGVGKGVSAYDSIVSEAALKNDAKKVLADSPYTGGGILWLYLPTRKLKLLRVEFFTPSRGTYGPISDKGYVEPLFFEYRATGKHDEMELTAMGGTAAGNNFNGVNLPPKIKLTWLSAIQIWLQRDGNSGNLWQDLIPYTNMVYFNETQMAQVPSNCQ
ncbi:hypothetical protein [Enterobacter sichuanensis]|uniref:hypothetical protein n=1 Tax=Enterobacter sichuanensis TaxID=2071710 RepID=UPI002075FBB2|nr:hypothetical protein [Enterobacter sichuanensis]MCM7885064.1 hypothetical protein [Enterobacter sichuanensis]